MKWYTKGPQGRELSLMRKTTAVGSVALAVLLAICGCTAAPRPPQQDHAFTTVPTPSVSAPASTRPLASEFVDSVLVTVYPAGQFTSSVGCGCKINDKATEELFPAGTPVLVLRISLSGVWKPTQGDTTTQNVTGTTLTGTRFDGRPEAAVLDTTDGSRAAHRLGLPWLPAGLFAGHSTWTVPNKHERSFVAAWYVPQGVDRLLLKVDIPSEGKPTDLFVDLPDPVLKLLNASAN